MKWPKLIGGAVGCVSVGSCVLLAAFITSQHYLELQVLLGFCFMGVVSVALLVLSYFLWLGRSWSLTALRVLCWLLACSTAAFLFAGAFRGEVHASEIFGVLGI